VQTSTPLTVTSGQTLTSTLRCPTGKSPIAAGFEALDESPNVQVLGSTLRISPVDGVLEAFFKMRNPGGQAEDVNIQITCAIVSAG